MKTAARLFVSACVLSLFQCVTASAQAPTVEICLVTVDTASTHNIVVWEKPTTEAIDSFLVYRMFPDSIYYEVGAVHYDSLSIFHDYDANADPNTNKHRYKLSTLDTAGVESALSPFHQTMHLTVSTAGDMFWSWYKIQGANNPVSMFNCYRDDDGTGDFQVVNVAAGNVQAWNDNDFGLYPSSRYVVDVDWSISCDASRENVNTTRSNLDERVAAPPVGIDQALIDGIQLYPNPTNGPIFLQIPSELNAREYVLWSSLGAVSYSRSIPTYGSNGFITMDIPSLASGNYIVELRTDLGVLTKKLIVR
ncbi:MAG: hypothetical protein RL266_2626 [Bacteroidota bacterium]|jgi:hypothetical protein